MTTYVFRLFPPRADFALTMSDEERDVMERHAAHWGPHIASGRMVLFGPCLDGTGSWGLGVLEGEGDDEPELRDHAAKDPAVTDGGISIELGKLLVGYVRPQPAGV